MWGLTDSIQKFHEKIRAQMANSLTNIKICYISPLSIHSHRYIEAFVQKGYNISLVTDSRTWITPNELSIPLDKLPILNRKNFFQRMVPNTLRLVKILKQVSPDIVHLHAQHQYSPAILLSHLPFILTSWGKEVLALSHADPAWFCLAKATASKAEKVTVDAKCLKNIWINMGVPEEKIEVIPFGVDTKRFNPNIDGSDIRKKLHIDEEDEVVISTRPYYSDYNISCLIRAIPSVLAKHKNVKFIVKGSGPLENHLKSIAERLNVSSNIRFVGIVPYNEVPKYLSAADIYVSTCLVDSASVSLLEAMACRLPPVVTDIPGNREWIENGKNGLLFPPKNPKALAGKLVQLIEDKRLRQSFGRKCVQIIQDRAMWEECVSKMETIYKSLL